MTEQPKNIPITKENNYLPSPRLTLNFMLIFVFLVFIFYINNITALKYFSMLSVAVIAFFSRNKLQWLVVYFIIIDQVGGFFTETAVSATNIGLPALTLFAGVTIGIKDLLLLALVLSISTGRKFKKITTDHVLIALIIIFSTMVGFLVYEANYKSVVTFILRGYFILLLFFVIRENFTAQQLFSFFHLVSLLLPFIIVDQIFTAVTGTRLLERFLGLNLKVAVNSITMETRSTPYGINTVVFSFLYGLMLLSVHNRNNISIASYSYGAFLVVATVFSVLLSATRGFIFVFAAILIVVSPHLVIRFRNIAITLGIIIVLLNILGSFGLGIDYFYRNTIARVMLTVAPALSGQGLSQIDTSGRNLEIPIVLETIKGSPLIGYGISTKTLVSLNNNFGGLNSFIMFGILGVILILFLLLRWVVKLNRELKYIPKTSVHYAMGHVVFAALIGMLLGYITTYDYFTSSTDYDVFRLVIVSALSFFVFEYGRQQQQAVFSNNKFVTK